MTEHERAEAIYDLQEIARQHERLEKAWVDVVIAYMELEFAIDARQGKVRRASRRDTA